MTKVLEGTWDELATHAAELEGRRLRLIVLDEASVSANGTNNSTQQEETLLEAVLRVGTIDGPPSDVAKDGKRLWGEYVMEKHRRIRAQSEEQ